VSGGLIRSVTLAFLLTTGLPFAAQAQTLLFSSGFESNTALRPVAQADCWSTGCCNSSTEPMPLRGLPGTAIWGSTFMASQLLADAPVDPTTVRNYTFNQIVTLTGHNGTRRGPSMSKLPKRVLRTRSTVRGDADRFSDPTRQRTHGRSGRIYISYWLKVQADLDTQLDPQNCALYSRGRPPETIASA